jgi:Cu(I)/Ag(I) efflux system membrane fusion protein
MKRTLVFRAALLGVLALGGLLALSACSRRGGPESKAVAGPARYHCPMHPTYVSDRPGDCRICGMKLVPFEAGPSPEPASATLAGRAAVHLSAERRMLLRPRSEAVRVRPVRRTLRTVGRVAVDERRLHHIHIKYDGYVEHLYVDFTGRFVRKGEPLLSIYSPELLATQQEYLLAFRAKEKLGASGIASVAEGGLDLLAAARQRLLFWDVRPDDIAALERTGEVKRTLDLHAEVSGFVVQKMAFHGMRVTPADTLYDIADLSRLWVLADVYEADLPLVRLGMPAEVAVPYRPDRTYAGFVTNVAPTLDEKTRTVKVRIEVANEGQELKPEMFADVRLAVDLGRKLVCPESAVLEAGERRIVFLMTEHDAGATLEPREVALGRKLDEGYEVHSGLAEGDLVVVSANFLLDSESSLRAALADIAGEGASPRPSPSSAAGRGHVH